MDDTSLKWRSDYAVQMQRCSFALGGLPGMVLTSLGMLVARLLALRLPEFVEIAAFTLVALFSSWYIGKTIILKSGLLQPRPNLFCPHCAKHIAIETPWICGYCDCIHAHPRGYQTFLGKCSQCGRDPEEFLCSHCKQSIALIPAAPQDNAPLRHPARRFDPSMPVESPEEAKTRAARERAAIEERTRLTQAQALQLRAEADLIRTETGLSSLRNPKVSDADTNDERLDMGLFKLQARLREEASSDKQIRAKIDAFGAALQESDEFRSASAAHQRRILGKWNKFAEQLEQASRENA